MIPQTGILLPQLRTITDGTACSQINFRQIRRKAATKGERNKSTYNIQYVEIYYYITYITHGVLQKFHIPST